MARADDDSWDLANSVGATATMVAAARAAASRRHHIIVNDPFAEPLVRAVGVELFVRLAAGELDDVDAAGNLGFPRMIDTFAARAKYFDDYFAEAGSMGVQQFVILASGLDCRPYRLPWPGRSRVFEIDQPEVIEFKTSTLRALGVTADVEHRTVGIDLRDEWPAALLAAGFDVEQPTAWLAEGLLIGFLPQEAEVRLLDDIIGLSDSGSWLAADYGQVAGRSVADQQAAQRMTDSWRELGLDMDIAGLTYPGEHTDVAAHLWANRWNTITSDLAELFSAAGLAPLGDAGRSGPAKSIGFVRASSG
ncbi:class I SAM-dependent methyltransferase [Mycobacterium gordonae]|uniref:class I SAM-dependent methyltransferase n=1 Tax=Mycobacterium TaxID=1763 RepID=UPI000CB737B6|nr:MULTISPECIES: class I SAM-dependent methyltransferase [Mycobacterium]MBX9978664.1 class I SAM-dependent methyltransferase [Mycobacterium gordonae]MCQ4365493.1 class I SAM-dependent methyltransferase [Mycobacterium gordonae]PJE07925.1 MAG: SAM-dependent methyltransferase [Mycobacterium sp.]